MNRRQFNKTLLATGSSLAISAGFASASDAPVTSRAIPSSGEHIPVVGIGTSRFGVGDDLELRAPLKEALSKFHELGGSVIDTAPGYRSSETVLGELIRELGFNDDLFMATKVDVEGRDECVARMNRSLDRLNKNPMELMQVHNFIGWEGALPLMQEWKDEGRLRYIGITTSRYRQYDVMEKVMNEYDLDFVQVNYSLANQRKAAERILPLAADREMAVMVNRPFGGGGVFKRLSSTKFPDWATDFAAESWGQFLLKYALSHPAVTCAIPGMTKARHVSDNMAAATGRMPDADERARMESFFDSLLA